MNAQEVGGKEQMEPASLIPSLLPYLIGADLLAPSLCSSVLACSLPQYSTEHTHTPQSVAG